MSFRKEFVVGFADELNALIQEDGGLNLSKDTDFNALMDFLYEYIDRIEGNDSKTNFEKADELKDVKSEIDKLIEDANNNRISLYEDIIEDALNQTKKSENWRAERLNRRKEDIQRLLAVLTAKIKEYSFLGNNYDIKGDRWDNLRDMRRANRKFDRISEKMAVAQRSADRKLTSMSRSVEAETKKSELELILLNKLQLKKMNLKTKGAIITMQNKFFKRLKTAFKLLGAFYLMGAVKKLAEGINSITQPMFQPFVNWFMRNMPALKDYLGKIADALQPIANFVQPLVDLYKEWFSAEEQRKRMEAAMHGVDESGNIKRLSLDELNNAIKMTGSDFMRMVAYASTGATVGSIIGGVIGSVAPGVGNFIGSVVGTAVGAIAGAAAGFAQSKMEQIQKINTIKEHYNQLKASLNKAIDMIRENDPNPDPYAIQALKLQIANIDYSLAVINLATWNQGAFFGLNVLGEGLLKGKLDNIKKEEEKLAKISEQMSAERAAAAEAGAADYIKAQFRGSNALKDIQRVMSSIEEDSADSAQGAASSAANSSQLSSGTTAGASKPQSGGGAAFGSASSRTTESTRYVQP